MATVQLSGVAIRGVVCAVPGDPIPVSELGSHFAAAEVEKIAKTIGLKELYRVGANQTAGDLAMAAAQALLDDLGWERESVDGLIMVTQTPDHLCPATACVIHGKMSLSDQCLAYDVNQGCSGYVYGLFLAAQAVASGASKRFLLLAGDTSSVSTSSEDRSVAMLFGDAGTATALEFDAAAPPISFVLGTDGTGSGNLIQPAGGYRQPVTAQAFNRVDSEEGNRRAATELYMDGLAVFNFTLKRVPALINAILEKHGWTRDEVDRILFHQANGFILNMMAKKLKLAPGQAPINIDRYGNTSMSSIPLLLADDVSAEITGGSPIKVILAGFGIGYSWAAAAVTMGSLTTARILHVDRNPGAPHIRSFATEAAS